MRNKIATNMDWITVESKRTRSEKRKNDKYNEYLEKNYTKLQVQYITNISAKETIQLRPICKSDYTLTENEEILVQNANVFCNCCQPHLVEEIIKRSFTSCGTCYCCAGDNPSFDNPDLCIFVNVDNVNSSVIFWDKNSPCKYYD